MKIWTLEPQPIPRSSWGISLAQKLPPEEWDKIRKKCLKEAGYKCSVCHSIGVPLHCHEVWTWKRNTQTLVAFVCLCKVCHDCVHYFRSTQVHGTKYVNELLDHMIKINGVTRQELITHLERIMQEHQKRSRKTYKVIAGKIILAHRR